MGREPRKEDREESKTGRKARIPLGTPRLKLAAEHLAPEGMTLRWVNDDPGRLEAAKQGGWTHVTNPKAEVGEGGVNERDPMSSHVRLRVGTREGGRAKVGYLMMIPKDLYDEDQAEKQANIDRTEEGLRRGQVDGGLAPQDGMYQPDEGIKITHDKVQRRSG